MRHGATYDDAEAFALDLAAQKGGRFISPYNDPDVIAGQATVGSELLAQVPDVATVVVPVGGGGLLAGLALATVGREVQLVGVEPDRWASMTSALADDGAGYTIDGQTMADGLAGGLEPGSITVELARRARPRMITVSEEEMAAAIRQAAFDLGLVLEASGAAGLAAWRREPAAFAAPTVLLLTGRNIARQLLAEVLAG